jgi:hypothetical protein
MFPSFSNKCLRTAQVGICISAVVSLVACGSGSSNSTSTATITYTTINSSASSANSTSLTGIRGVNNSTNVYITGGAVTSSNVWSNQLYVGPIVGGGIYYTLNVPGSNSTTNAYSVDNWSGNQVSVVGNYTNSNGDSRGFLYQGPVANNNMLGTVGAAPWYDISYSTADTTYASIPHSVMNNIVVGGFQRVGVTAYICDISSPTTPICNDMRAAFASLPVAPASSSAYGVWWNGETRYTIVGGYSSVVNSDLSSTSAKGVKGFIVDYDASSKTYSHFMSYDYNNDASGIYTTHFEGITVDPTKGGYNLAGEGITANGTMNVGLAHVSRTADGGFTTKPKWVTVSYPNATVTTSDTVYQNNILGVYQPGSQVLNGYVANIPTNLY